MTHWLQDLIHEKECAILEERRRAAVKDRPSHERGKLMAILQESQVEESLMAMVQTVLAGHPHFPTALLRRQIGSLGEPWTCILWQAGQNGAPAPYPSLTRVLSQDLRLLESMIFDRIEWFLDLGIVKADGPNETHRGVRVSLSSPGLGVNGTLVSPPTTENIQRTLITAFKTPVTWPAPVATTLPSLAEFMD